MDDGRASCMELQGSLCVHKWVIVDPILMGYNSVPLMVCLKPKADPTFACGMK